MNLYPAIRFRMGNWNYYVVRMSMRELSENVKFAYQVYEDRTLDEAIQRVLNERRVKKDIVTYLKRQPDRFFSSVVIAALGGEPKFYNVEITDDEKFAVFRDDRRLNETFGILRFDGSQDYYALDGQHRLAAIKTLLDTSDELSEGAPEGFPNDEISVIVVVPSDEEGHENFMRRYRRLFSNLNRYAKAMDQATNIIMDEDDVFAILTRRLITEHEFFTSPGRHRESRRIKTDRGKNLREGDSYFTSIETFYDMNKELLSSRSRENRGWGPEPGAEKLEEFVRFRPDEEVIEALYHELTLYWNGILEEIPYLRNDPANMRVHSLTSEEESAEQSDNLLFWPIGQEMLAKLARDLLDRRLADPEHPDADGVSRALRGLGSLEWRLHHPPWRYFLLTQDPKTEKWKMRSEDRTEAVRVGRRIQMWVLGDELDDEEVEDLKSMWSTRLIPNQPPKEEEKMWKEVVAKRSQVTQLLT
jgi:DNA sulfur modification protein DndB